MDCKYMIEINDKGLFQDMRTGLRYHEITKEMIEGCLDDEIDNSYEGWGLTKNEVFPASRCLKLLNPVFIPSLWKIIWHETISFLWTVKKG